MLLRLGKSTVAVLESLSRHPGYARMRAKHLTLLRMVAWADDGNANPSAQANHPSSSFSTIPLSQRFFDFRFLNDWQEVQAVVDRLGPELSPMHLEAAYSRVKFLKLRPSTEFMDELANRAISLSHCMTARNISSILHACAKLRYNNPVMVETLAQTMLSHDQIKGLDSLEMASVVFALGALNQLSHAANKEKISKERGGESTPMLFASQKEFTQELITQLCSGDYFQNFTEQQLASVISGLAKLKCQDSSAQHALANVLLKPGHINGMKFFDISSLWGNLGQMQFKPKDALDALAEEIMQPSRLAGFKPLELSYIMHGCGLLNYQDKTFLEAMMSEVTKEDRLTGFREKELANIVYAAGNLDIRDKYAVGKLLEEATRSERVGLFTEQGLGNIVFSLRRLGYGSDPRLESLLKESKEHMPSSSSMSDSQLLAMVFGAGTTVDEDDVSKTLIKEILDPERIKHFSDESLSGILNGLHQIGYSEPKGLDICLREVKSRLPKVNLQVLGYFSYGLRVNKITDHDILNAFAEEVVKPNRLSEITSHSLIGIFHTLCSNGWSQRDLVRTIINEVQSPERLSKCPEQSLAAVFSGLSEIGYVPREAELIPLLEEVIRPERLPYFTDKALASIIVSTARLKCAPRELAIPPVVELCTPGRLVKLRNPEVAQAVYNLGQLRYRNNRVVPAAVQELLKPDRLLHFKRIELSMIVYGLGLLKLRDQDAATALASQIVLPDVLENFKNHELANIIHGFGNMRLQCSKTIEKLSSEGVREERLKKYKHAEVSNIFYGLCTFPAELVGSAAQVAFSELRSRSLLRLSSGAQIAQIALGIGNLGIKNFSGALEVLDEAIRDDRLVGYKAFELSHICYFVGQLLIKDTEVIDKIVSEVLRPHRIPSMSQNELSVASRNLALVACKSNRVFSAISEEMMKRFFEELPDNTSAAA